MNYLVLSLVIPLLIIFVFHRSNVKVVDPLQDSGADNGPVVQGEFTPRTLYKHNGFDTETIYIAVKGKVFDVSRARQFYGPSGPYSNFAGHDASRGLALNSFEMDVITPIGEPIDTLDDLTEQDHKSLDGWEEMFQSKYPQVGTLVNE